MNTTSLFFRQFWTYAGPLALVLVWCVCVLLGWASVGRFRALLEWGALLSLTGLTLAGIGFGVTVVAVDRLKRKHDRMAHNGVSDARALSRTERQRFVAVHLQFAFGVFGISCVVGGFLTGFAFSGVLFGCGLIVASILVCACLGLSKDPTSAVSFFVQPSHGVSRTGRETWREITHPSYIRSALNAAYDEGPQAVSAREFLNLLGHERAFWPNLRSTMRWSLLAQVRWRTVVLLGLRWHLLTAAFCIGIMVVLVPTQFLPPLPSPLDVLTSFGDDDTTDVSEEDTAPEEQTEEPNEDADAEGEPEVDQGGADKASDESGEDGEGDSGEGEQPDESGEDGDSGEDEQPDESGEDGDSGEGEQPDERGEDGDSGEGEQPDERGEDGDSDEGEQPDESGEDGEASDGEGDAERQGAGEGSGKGQELTDEKAEDGAWEQGDGGAGKPAEGPPDSEAPIEPGDGSGRVPSDKPTEEKDAEVGEGDGEGGSSTSAPAGKTGNVGDAEDGTGELTQDAPVGDPLGETDENGSFAFGEQLDLPDDRVLASEEDNQDGAGHDVTTRAVSTEEGGERPTETSDIAAQHPFAVRGRAPEEVVISQESPVAVQDDLPEPPDPVQHTPSWILDLEKK